MQSWDGVDSDSRAMLFFNNIRIQFPIKLQQCSVNRDSCLELNLAHTRFEQTQPIDIICVLLAERAIFYNPAATPGPGGGVHQSEPAQSSPL